MLSDTTRDKQLTAIAANVAENLRVTEAGLALAHQKLAKFDEELQLLERQTTFLRRNIQLDQLLATQRAQKQLLGQRIPFLADQVDALRQSRDFLKTHRELLGLEARKLDELADELGGRVSQPAVLAAGDRRGHSARLPGGQPAGAAPAL
ncbi:MAG: hypothetical protein EXS42_09845 [Lacunisphaera sp.]|nr:hypothetical protein [Lacunisphaera sp.]